MSEVAQTLGQRLKAERERRGVSKQKAADEMHLDAWVIDALETGDYQRIGPPVYAKGHLRRYATSLGLPTEEVASGYEGGPAAPAAPALQPANVRMRFSAQESAVRPWTKMTAVAAIAVAVGGIIWWRPWHQRSSVNAAAPADLPASAAPAGNPDAADAPAAAGGAAPPSPSMEDSPPSAPPSALPAVAPGVAPTVAPVVTPLPAPGAAPAAGEGAASAHEADTLPGAGPARIRLSFSADSWVDVHDSAGRRLFAGNGRANSVKTIAGTAPLTVYLGYAGGVQLEINDRAVAIGPQFVSGNAARFEAGADAVLRRGSRPATAGGAQSRSDAPHD